MWPRDKSFKKGWRALSDSIQFGLCGKLERVELTGGKGQRRKRPRKEEGAERTERAGMLQVAAHGTRQSKEQMKAES